MQTGNSSAVTTFEETVATIPNLVQAHRLFGEPDYQLHIAAASKQHFQELYDEHLSTLPGVQRLTSTLVMKSVVERRAPL
ncbi:MAG: Lrp/AsnC ligand binding domain-containing protein [Canibacter sp.]